MTKQTEEFKPLSLILAYANSLAKASGFKQVIKPIPADKWLRPTTMEDIGAFKLVSPGIITAPEACVISNFRLEYTLVAEGARCAMLIVFAQIAETLQLETAREVIDYIQDTAKRVELMNRLGVSQDKNIEWQKSLQDIKQPV